MTGDTLITIIGNLTDNPELTTTVDGHSVASFTVAVISPGRPRPSKTPDRMETVFMRCTIWRHPAEHAAKTLRRGMRVIVFGRLTQHAFQTGGGDTRVLIECEAHEIGPSLRYATATIDHHHNPSTKSDTRHGHMPITADGASQ